MSLYCLPWILYLESSQLAPKPSRPNQIQPTRHNTGSPQYRLAPVVLQVSRSVTHYRLAPIPDRPTILTRESVTVATAQFNAVLRYECIN